MKAKDFLKAPIDNNIYLKKIADSIEGMSRTIDDSNLRLTIERLNDTIANKPDTITPIEVKAPTVEIVAPPVPMPNRWKFTVERDSAHLIKEIIAEKIE